MQKLKVLKAPGIYDIPAKVIKIKRKYEKETFQTSKWNLGNGELLEDFMKSIIVLKKDVQCTNTHKTLTTLFKFIKSNTIMACTIETPIFDKSLTAMTMAR